MHSKAAFACVLPQNEDWNVACKLPSNTKHTNNRAAYFAALEAIKRANTQDPSQTQPLQIFTNNKVLIHSMTEWLPVWMNNNWVTANGTPVKNNDILKKLCKRQGLRTINWEHLGTKKNSWMAKADRLAKAALRKNKKN
ncbi:ribonuclease [Thraustotheca clavata]|uniref:ribonuclease H n=1 Tax=Thraustotheca clavata TaxID=74557 RepID=A0A1W0A5X0_9STRA|nr:ribonuclease [Thraustotheca clavata]